ncbi:unnamed protein product [Arctogadus glacialis]
MLCTRSVRTTIYQRCGSNVCFTRPLRPLRPRRTPDPCRAGAVGPALCQRGWAVMRLRQQMQPSLTGTDLGCSLPGTPLRKGFCCCCCGQSRGIGQRLKLALPITAERDQPTHDENTLRFLVGRPLVLRL